MPADTLRAVFVGAATLVCLAAIAIALLQHLSQAVQTVLAALELRRTRARERRANAVWSLSAKVSPGISLLVPAYNEERTLVDNIRSLLTLRYPSFEIVVVNDGSRDATLQRVREAFQLAPVFLARPMRAPHRPVRGFYRSPAYPNLLLIDKENGGKSDALNAALNFSQHPLVCAVDADSLLDHHSLLRAVRPFAEHPGTLLAVGGAIRVANGSDVHGGMVVHERAPRSWLPLFQTVEYLRAFLIARLALSRTGTVSIISGAFGLFRRSAVLDVGGYTHGTVGEDMELVVKLHRRAAEAARPGQLLFLPDPVCWTEVPDTLRILRRQRTRWQRGLCETLWRHRTMLFNPRYGRIGLFGLPQFLVLDVVGPLLECAGLVLVPLFWLAGALSLELLLTYFLLVTLFGVFLSMIALVLGELAFFKTTRKRDMALYAIAAIAENFGYRQLNSLWRLEGLWQFLRQRQGWGEMTRAGFKRKPTPTSAPPSRS
jgi:cellulose synthase/poly-beta-1,6-N-acetylglucosamine synthase-like glycosyltransferase